MSPSVLLVVGVLLHCGLPSATAVRANYTELFSSFDLKQRIAYRIGQVECLKTLLSDNATQYGLGAFHHGDYNTDIKRFSIKQRIAFLHGQVQCLRIHLTLEGDRNRTRVHSNNNTLNQDNTVSQDNTQKGVIASSYFSNIKLSFVVYLDCKDAYQNGRTASGLYTINPDNQTAFQVYCDMDTSGGGWTVIQRRFDGSVSFDRTWSECARGFGNKTGEYWLGLNYIHRLTTSAGQLLRVDLEDFQSNTAFAQYTTFTVANVTDKYRLLVSGYSGTANDAMTYNSGYQFTYNDNDTFGSTNCASHYKGPWWHKICSFANLNAKYYRSGNTGDRGGMTWYQWKGQWYSMKKADMKIRRK